MSTTSSNGSNGSNGNGRAFNGVQIFSATMAKERDQLGDRVTQWMRSHPEYEIVDSVVTQSSDDAFHCLAITLFYHENL